MEHDQNFGEPWCFFGGPWSQSFARLSPTSQEVSIVALPRGAGPVCAEIWHSDRGVDSRSELDYATQ